MLTNNPIVTAHALTKSYNQQTVVDAIHFSVQRVLVVVF
jgi:ABC-type multidrug transport system ATPase subunit